MRKFKKIASILASTVMLGSTFGFAGLAAASTYPEPFVMGGSADVALVWGGPTKAPLDAASVVDISSSLTNQVTAGTVSGGTDSTVTGGDFVLLSKSSDNLNLGDTWGIFTGTVDHDDLSTLLADGTYRADDNDEFDYEQKITLGAPTLTHFRDSDYESLVGLGDKTPTLGFKLNSNTFIMNYTLDFIENAESDNVTGGTDLEDFEGSDVTLLGKSYYVSDFKQGTGNTFGEVTLLDSASIGTVEEGETTTITSGDTTYDVSISFIDSDEVKFLVNGELAPSSGKLMAGSTYRLSDNTYIGVRDVSKTEVAGTVGQVTFSVGSGKLELTSGSDVKLNDDNINGLKSYVFRTNGQDLDKIVLEWKTDEEMFLTPESELTLPGFESVKFSMNKFVRNDEEKVILEKDSDTSLELTMPIKDGDVSLNLLYINSTGEFVGLGKSATEKLATSGTNTITFHEKTSAGADQDDYFVATYNATQEAESYLLRAKVTQDTTQGRNETTLEKNVDGTWEEVCKEKAATDTCDIGDVSLTIDSINYTSGGTELVTITGGSNVNFNTIYTPSGLKIFLPFTGLNDTTTKGLINFSGVSTANTGNGPTSYYLYMQGQDRNDNLASGTAFSFTIDETSDNNVQVVQVNTTGGGAGSGSGGPAGLEIADSSTYEAYVIDDTAPRLLHYTNPDEDWAEVYYASGESESYAEVFLTETSASIVSGTTGGSSGTGAANIVSISDSEIASVAGKSVIVIGGSCVNSVAADLLNVPSPTCGADWTAATNVNSGEYLIESFDRTDGSMATVVAGYNAGDTTNAAKYLTTQDGVDTTSGTKYIGTTQTSATIVTDEVTAPAAGDTSGTDNTGGNAGL